MVENMKNIFLEKMLEQHISFNFLKSKVSDLEKIYETNLSLMGKKTKKVQIS